MHRPATRTGLLSFLVAALVVACGSPSPSATPGATTGATPRTSASAPAPSATGTPGANGDAAIYAGIESQVEQLRELAAKQKLDPTLLDEKGVLDFMTKAFDAQSNAQQLSAAEAVLKHLGLLQPSASLRQIELDLQSSQVIGFYHIPTKKLYVVSSNGQVGPTQKVTFAHEFTHALQDQHFNLGAFGLNTADQGDLSLARLAVVEGDAMISMTQWAQKNLSLAELLQIATMSMGASQEQLDAAPAILRDELMFPYLQGVAFVQSIYKRGGWSAVDAVYANPPDSTSQILHPALYAQHVQPVTVAVPALPASLAGWKLTTQDTLGEFELGIWLAGGDSTKQTASDQAVSQWAGDRLGLYDGPDGKWALAMQTDWRSTEGASAFAAAVTNASHAEGAVLDSCSSGTRVEVVMGSDAAVADAFGCGGD